MKATGIVRRIDDLGRVVIPKEIRRTLRLDEGAPLEIYTDREGSIILKKYSPVAELGSFAGRYAEALASGGYIACITDRSSVIASAGGSRKELQGKALSPALEEKLRSREVHTAAHGERGFVPPVEAEDMPYSAETIAPIISGGDVIGSVLLLSKERGRRMGDTEKKLAATAAGFLGKQMEL